MPNNRYSQFFYGQGRPSDRVLEVKRPEHDNPDGGNASWCADPADLIVWYDGIRYATNLLNGSITSSDFPDPRGVLVIRQLITFLKQDTSIKVAW